MEGGTCREDPPCTSLRLQLHIRVLWILIDSFVMNVFDKLWQIWQHVAQEPGEPRPGLVAAMNKVLHDLDSQATDLHTMESALSIRTWAYLRIKQVT